MGKTNAERQKLYRERHKNDPDFRNKEKKRLVEYRQNCKQHETTETKESSRVNSLMRVRKHREKQFSMTHSGYKSVQSRAKAVAKVLKRLPKSPGKRVEILSIVTENTIGVDISPVAALPTQKPTNLSIHEMIENFYRSDVVSQVSSETKHRRSSKTHDVEIRVMTLTVMEAYAAFKDEHPNLQCSHSMFRKQRPESVFLMKQTPYNVCLCSHHENFKFKIQCVYQKDPIVFKEFKSLTTVESIILCDESQDKCYLTKCNSCSKRVKLRNLFNNLTQEQQNSTVTWFEWKTISTTGFKQISKVENSSTFAEFFDKFLAECDAFMLHVYIQRTHLEKFKQDKMQALIEDSSKAVLQVDFAENYRCFEQNATQAGHYGYNLVTIFTIGFWHRIYESQAIVTDANDHTKESIIPMLDLVFEKLPETVKHLSIYSDNPTSQFKNRFICEAILRFQKKYGITIDWTFFAPEHGKGTVDGIGATLKIKARRMVLSGRGRITDAASFVRVVNNTAIKVIHMPKEEMILRRASLKYEEIPNAKPVPGIGKSYFTSYANEKPTTYLTYKQSK